MRTYIINFISVFIFTIFLTGANAQELHITSPDDIEIMVGDSIKLEAVYKNESGDIEMRTVNWTVNPDTLGEFNTMDYFIALHPGKGYIHAQIDTLSDSVEVKVKFRDDEMDYPELKIKPDDIEVAVGDSVYLQAIYKHANGEKSDTTANWSVEPDSLGYFNAMNYFIAEKVGKGHIYAVLDTLTDSVKVTVTPADDIWPEDGHLMIMPMDTVVQVGQYVQFMAYFVDKDSVWHDTTATWSITGNPVGSLTGDGLFFSVLPGISVVKAKLNGYESATTVAVIDTITDTTGTNHISISRVLPGSKVLPPHQVKEGGIYKIGGIPNPYNIINGGMLYFPNGSLQEDITIHIKLPEKIKVWNDSLDMKHKIVNGIQFDVLVEDSLIEPYYFERPLHVSIPFKRGILKKYDISAEDLYLYFMTDSMTFDTIGISNVYVDSVANRIFGQVEHFSTLVVKAKMPVTTKTESGRSESVPGGFALLQNYPNPFNPVTTISFALPEAARVILTVYSLTGQKVDTIVSDSYNAGIHEIQWNAHNLASGVYYYQLVAGDYRQVKKMILLR